MNSQFGNDPSIFGETISSKAAIKMLENIQNKIVGPLLVLNHMCSGLPGRGTEIAALTVLNSHRAHRDVFIPNRFSVLFNPNKAKNEKGKSICRVVYNEIAIHNICYIMFIHPLAV